MIQIPKMQLNLNSFQEEVHFWKNLLRRKDKEIETLQKKCERSLKEIEVLEETGSGLLQEVAGLNSILSTIHNSVSRFENHEEEKKKILLENKRLEDCICQQKKIQKEEIDEMNNKIEKLKLEHKKETEEQLLQLESKVSAKQESYVNLIKEKDKHIMQLEAEVLQIKSEKEQDMLKLKVEKYMKLEKEAKDENELLKIKIKELQLEIDSMKKQNHTAPSCLVQDSPKNDSHQSVEQDSVPRKRIRLGQYDKYPDFDNIKSKILSDSTQLVRPVKKKLFNLDFNYF